MEYFVVYKKDTGELLMRGTGYDGAAAQQPLGDGQAVMRVPQQAFDDPVSLDLGKIKDSYAASIDQDADKVRGLFITNTPGQMAAYLEKEAEARRILAGDTGPTPFITAEAEALEMGLPDLAAEVVAQADHWRPIGANIEAARRKAKVAITTADNLAQIAQATEIDWRAIIDTQPAE